MCKQNNNQFTCFYIFMKQSLFKTFFISIKCCMDQNLKYIVYLIGEWSLQRIIQYANKVLSVSATVRTNEQLLSSELPCTDSDVITISVSITYTTASLRKDTLFLYGNIFKNLNTCSVCFEVMIDNSYNCGTGHAVCANCKKKDAVCHECKEILRASRNFALEGIIPELVLNCKYKDCYNTHSKLMMLHDNSKLSDQGVSA